MRIILCIDDEPVRFRKLNALLASNQATADIRCVFSCRLEDVIEYLSGPYNIYGVCLDHDMPKQKGTFFAGILREKNYPVAIVSLNPDGAKAISYLLKEYETPHEEIPCTDAAFEARVLSFFKYWEK